MARKRTGSAVDEVDPSDETPEGDEVLNQPDEQPVAASVGAGHIKVDIHAKRIGPNGAKLAPGVYVLPRDEAMALVNVGVAKILQVG